jgi:hypothetical protein
VGRKLTTYRRPPIVQLIASCGSIQALERVRRSLIYGAYIGKIEPSEKTERAWEHAFWKRVVELILAADGVSACPTFIYNHQLRWPKPPGVAMAVGG